MDGNGMSASLMAPGLYNGFPFPIPAASTTDLTNIGAGGWFPVGLTFPQLQRWFWQVKSWTWTLTGTFTDERPSAPPIPYPSGSASNLVIPGMTDHGTFGQGQLGLIVPGTQAPTAAPNWWRSTSYYNAIFSGDDPPLVSQQNYPSGGANVPPDYGFSSFLQIFDPTGNAGSPNPVVTNGTGSSKLWYPSLVFGATIAGVSYIPGDPSAMPPTEPIITDESIIINSNYVAPYVPSIPPGGSQTFGTVTITDPSGGTPINVTVSIVSTATVGSVSLVAGGIAMSTFY